MTSFADTLLDAATGDIDDDDVDELDDLFHGPGYAVPLADEFSILTSLERTIRRRCSSRVRRWRST